MPERTDRPVLHRRTVFRHNTRVRSETTPEEYWASIGEQLGEPVRAYALGRLVSGDDIRTKGILAPSPRWGLIFITDSAVYIESGKSQNWFQKLITTRQDNDPPERQRIPVESITRVTIPRPKTGLYRLLSSPEVLVQLVHTGTPGTTLIYMDQRGSNDRKVMDLLARLNSPE